jgi:hypothetical protein
MGGRSSPFWFDRPKAAPRRQASRRPTFSPSHPLPKSVGRPAEHWFRRALFGFRFSSFVSRLPSLGSQRRQRSAPRARPPGPIQSAASAIIKHDLNTNKLLARLERAPKFSQAAATHLGEGALAVVPLAGLGRHSLADFGRRRRHANDDDESRAPEFWGRSCAKCARRGPPSRRASGASSRGAGSRERGNARAARYAAPGLRAEPPNSRNKNEPPPAQMIDIETRPEREPPTLVGEPRPSKARACRGAAVVGMKAVRRLGRAYELTKVTVGRAR